MSFSLFLFLLSSQSLALLWLLAFALSSPCLLVCFDFWRLGGKSCPFSLLPFPCELRIVLLWPVLRRLAFPSWQATKRAFFSWLACKSCHAQTSKPSQTKSQTRNHVLAAAAHAVVRLPSCLFHPRAIADTLYFSSNNSKVMFGGLLLVCDTPQLTKWFAIRTPNTSILLACS